MTTEWDKWRERVRRNQLERPLEQDWLGVFTTGIRVGRPRRYRSQGTTMSPMIIDGVLYDYELGDAREIYAVRYQMDRMSVRDDAFWLTEISRDRYDGVL